MSAPDTNIEKQKRNHWPPLWGFIAGGAFVLILGVILNNFGADPSTEEATSGGMAPAVSQ